MRHGSLFSGIGGFDLAAEWSGFTNVFQVEIDEFCQQVLKKNFPNTKRYYDIKGFKGTSYRGSVDIISGGFPCQPFSIAGRRKGDKDERALFSEMVRVINEIRPGWIVAENVYGLLNIHNGDYFEEICSSLESIKYEVQPIIIPASTFNAPHQRNRVWIIGRENSQDSRCEYVQRTQNKRELKEQNKQGNATKFERPIKSEGIRIITDTNHGRLERGKGKRNNGMRHNRGQNTAWDKEWIEVATEFCRVDDGLSVELDGLKYTKAGHRVERLKALGNAIVPQVAYQIFQAIKESMSNE